MAQTRWGHSPASQRRSVSTRCRAGEQLPRPARRVMSGRAGEPCGWAGAHPHAPRSLDRDGGEVEVAAELCVHLGTLDAGAVDEGELLADQRDDTAILADLLVGVAPGLLADVGLRDEVGSVERLVADVA